MKCTPPATAQVRAVQDLLDTRISVQATDDRIFIGTLLCLDAQGNVLLGQADEIQPRLNDRLRLLGMVLIKQQHIVDIWQDQQDVIA